jgi:hypothetical protein
MFVCDATVCYGPFELKWEAACEYKTTHHCKSIILYVCNNNDKRDDDNKGDVMMI